MKIRIKGNSVRMRLTRSEVLKLEQDGYLEEHTEFANATFTYALQQADVKHLSATFKDNKLVMHVPVAAVTEWVTSNQVGISHDMDTGRGKGVFLLLEKDFMCTDSNEDQSDYYENPSLNC